MVDVGGAISLGGGGGGISQLTGDVTAGPGSGSVADTLVGTNNVNTVVGNLPSVATNVVRRSATAQAAPGETTVFTGSTAGQTITMPNTGTYTDLVYRIVNDATVSVTIAGGVNSISVNGVIAASFVVPSNTSYDFVWDGTGVWQCMAISQNGGGALTSYQANIAADIALPVGAQTFILGAALSAGTWMVIATVDILPGATAGAEFDAFIVTTAGGSVVGSGATYINATTTPSRNTITVSAIVTALAGNNTEFHVYTSVGAGTAKASNSSSKPTTGLIAVKIA